MLKIGEIIKAVTDQIAVDLKDAYTGITVSKGLYPSEFGAGKASITLPDGASFSFSSPGAAGHYPSGEVTFRIFVGFEKSSDTEVNIFDTLCDKLDLIQPIVERPVFITLSGESHGSHAIISRVEFDDVIEGEQLAGYWRLEFDLTMTIIRHWPGAA